MIFTVSSQPKLWGDQICHFSFPGPWWLMTFQRFYTIVLTGHLCIINQDTLVACDRKPTQISLSGTFILGEQTQKSKQCRVNFKHDWFQELTQICIIIIIFYSVPYFSCFTLIWLHFHFLVMTRLADALGFWDISTTLA